MAVAAYASVLALMRSLDNALLRPLPNKSLIETLQEKVGLLQESLELLSPTHGATDDSTIQQIRGAVREADYLIDKYVVDQLRGGESDYDNSTFCEEIQALTQSIDSAIEELTMKTMGEDLQRRVHPSHAGASRVDSPASYTTTMVGFEDLSLKIFDDLTDGNLKLKVIGIAGMGGIGKTTLARSIYNSGLIAAHFDFRSWVTVSQEFDVEELLRGLLGGESVHDSVEELGTRLYRTLFGRRYLVVLDDVWSIEAWEVLRYYFPDNRNRSRILITTRIQSIVPIFSTNSYYIDSLDEECSWKLFYEKVFRHTSEYPHELEEIGKRIVRGCKGLPLAIVAVAASVSKFGYDLSLWEAFAENMESALDSDSDEGLTGVLSLSYNDLPIHLKLCFVSMTEFPKDIRIEVCRLVELWVAVGIVKPTGDRNMEEKVAVKYVENLIGRNMVTAVEKGSRGNIKTCAINGLLRRIGIKESQGESFLHVPKVQEISYSSLKSQNACFLCGKNGTQKRFLLQEVLVGSLSTIFLNPTVCDDCAYKHLDGSRYVRLVERVHDQRVEVPQVTKLTSLSIGDRFRFYSKEIVFASPSSVSLLWNLQRLYFHVSGQDVTTLLSKIWEMPQLRYLHLLRHALPEPEDKSSATVLQHLTTLKLVKNLRFTLEVVRRIPNLLRLSLLYDPDPKEGEELDCSYYCLGGLERFRDLQALKLACRRRSFDIKDVSLVMCLKNVSFPPSLVKLTLMDCKLSWDDMSVIGSLPNLEVLKLKRDSFVGEKWCTGEKEFPRLKYLKLEDLDLVSWTKSGNSNAFGSLTKLVLFGLYRLVEIPLLFLGESDDIQAIHTSFCTQDVVEAVKQITEERESNGYDNFRSVFEQ